MILLRLYKLNQMSKDLNKQLADLRVNKKVLQKCTSNIDYHKDMKILYKREQCLIERLKRVKRLQFITLKRIRSMI